MASQCINPSGNRISPQDDLIWMEVTGLC